MLSEYTRYLQMQPRSSLGSDKSDIVIHSLEGEGTIERKRGERGCRDNTYAYVRYICRAIIPFYSQGIIVYNQKSQETRKAM